MYSQPELWNVENVNITGKGIEVLQYGRPCELNESSGCLLLFQMHSYNPILADSWQQLVQSRISGEVTVCS